MKSCQTPSLARRSLLKSWFAKVLIPCVWGFQGLGLSAAAIAQTAPSPATVSPAQFPNPVFLKQDLVEAAKQESAKIDPFLNFPHYQPSTPDCFGKGLGAAFRLTPVPLATVVAFYKAELVRQKFIVTSIENTANEQIFQVSRGGRTRYLHLFQDTEATVILLADTKVPDLSSLKPAPAPPGEYINLESDLFPSSERGDTSGPPDQSSALPNSRPTSTQPVLSDPKPTIRPPDEYVLSLASILPSSDRDDIPASPQYEDFAKPELFFNFIRADKLMTGELPKWKPGVDSAQLVRGLTPEAVYKKLQQANLKRIFKQIQPVGQYEDGTLYRLSNDRMTIFLSLVSTRDKRGTIVVTWLAEPKLAKTDLFLNFPHYQPSTPDCFGKGLGEACRLAPAPLATVATFYKAELARRKFTVNSIENAADKQILQVSKDGKTLYLNLFQDTEATVILLAETRIPMVSLRGSVVPPEGYYELLNILSGPDRGDATHAIATYEDFAQPELFFRPISAGDLARGESPELQARIDIFPRMFRGMKPEIFYNLFLQPNLKQIFRREVREVGEYGGGKLYRLSKDQVTIFLNLVPTKDGQGTIAVTWLADPRQ